MNETEKQKRLDELEEEIQILEYAHLQLANGYGDRVSRNDLVPLRRLINRHKAELKKA